MYEMGLKQIALKFSNATPREPQLPINLVLLVLLVISNYILIPIQILPSVMPEVLGLSL